MDNKCRLCLTENMISMENIITSKLKCSDLNLIDCLYWIFGVEVAVYDPYSKYVCKNCIEVVEYVGYFRELYRKNQLVMQKKYKGILKEPLNKSEAADEKIRQNINAKNKKNNSYISLSLDVLQQYYQPILKIPKLEEDSIYDEYEKITDTLYKKRKDIRKGNNSKNRKYKDALTMTDSSDTNRVSVPINIFEEFTKPSLIFPRLEQNSNILEEYEKIDATTYRKVNYQFNSTSHTKSNKKRKLNLIEYYYRKPTSALRDLIKNKNDTLNKSEVNKSLSINNKSDENPSLFKVNKVFHVEVCHFCSKTFKTKERLVTHCKLFHQKSMIGKRKIRKRCKNIGKKFKQKTQLKEKLEILSKKTSSNNENIISAIVSNNSNNDNFINNSLTTGEEFQDDALLDTNVLGRENTSLDILLKVQNINDIRQNMKELQEKYQSNKLVSLINGNLSSGSSSTEQQNTKNKQNIDTEFKDMPILQKMNKCNNSITNTNRSKIKNLRKKKLKSSLPKMPRLIKMCETGKTNKPSNKNSHNKTERACKLAATKQLLNKSPQSSNRKNTLKIVSTNSTNENLTCSNNSNETYEPCVTSNDLIHPNNIKEKINESINSASKMKQRESQNFTGKFYLASGIKSENVEEHVSNHTNLDILLGNIVRNNNHMLAKTKMTESSQAQPLIYTNLTSENIGGLCKTMSNSVSELKNISVKSNVIIEKGNMSSSVCTNFPSSYENNIENILDTNASLHFKEKLMSNILNVPEDSGTGHMFDQATCEVINFANDTAPNHNFEEHNCDDLSFIEKVSYTNVVSERHKSGHEYESKQRGKRKVNGKTVVSLLSKHIENIKKTRKKIEQLKKIRLILQNEIVKSVVIDQNYIFRDRVCF